MIALLLVGCLVPSAAVIASYLLGWWRLPVLRGRARVSSDRITRDWGWLVGAGVPLAIGVTITMVLMVIVGEFSQRVEPVVDVPMFEAFADLSAPTVQAIAEVTTQMGNRLQTKIIAAVFSLALILLPRYRGRNFWFPAVAIWGAYAVEKFLQESLAVIVDRGHPPTTLGTFPSGGVARIVVVWGMVSFLIWLASGRRRDRVGAWLVAVVALATGIESFSRIFLLQHWATDVFASWLFGPLLLVATSAAAYALLRGREKLRPAWR